MSVAADTKPEKFGTVLGIAPGNVPAYSSDYRSADRSELPNRSSYRSLLDGIYLGYKWQCVEFARRWLYVNKGYIFDDVAMAYDIFRLRSVRRVSDRQLLPLQAFANGSRRHPEPGCLIIWAEGGEFENTGHVAVAVEVTADYVRVAEQNVGHRRWGEGRDWAREIGAEMTEDGEFWLECSFGDAEIIGWVIQTESADYAEELEVTDQRLFNLQERELAERKSVQRSWLNIANEDEKAYVAMMGGHKLSSNAADQRRYYVMSESAHEELVQATNSLHLLFMHATEHVLQDDRLLEYFNLPRVLWPKIHQSWDNRLNQMITGRFDFSVSERGIKTYEYNCDSASLHMECGKVQGKWADYYECEDGDDPGAGLHDELLEAWKRSDVDGVLHIMQDEDPEETYHALFMKDALDEAEIRCKILHGVKELHWADDGRILDRDGEAIQWVWKTWAWETALDQLRAEIEESTVASRSHLGAPRLVDVLLRDEVMVYEPLWTLIPSNKAILPILWELFPNHPYLLQGAFELTSALRQSGYAAKPIVGRCGSNISMFDEHARLVEASGGLFTDRAQIFQQWFPLPRVGKYNVQVSTFTAAGHWAGSCLRVDESRIINNSSDNLALRIVPDRELL